MRARWDGTIGIEPDKYWFRGDKVELRFMALLFWGRKGEGDEPSWVGSSGPVIDICRALAVYFNFKSEITTDHFSEFKAHDSI
jgi:hypothetical protein